MVKISIIKQEDRGKNWLFSVTVNGSNYQVTLDKDYYQQLTVGKIEPTDLIIKSFEFLLAREPASSILGRFNLRQINDYFPEFEENVK